MTSNTSQTQKSLLQLQAVLEELQNETMSPLAAQRLKEALRQLENYTVEMNEREEQKRLAALYKVSQMLSSSLNQDEVLSSVMDAVLDLTGARRGFLMLKDEFTHDLQLVVGRGLEPGELDSEDMKLSQTVIDMVMKSGEALVTTNAQEDPRLSTSGSVASFSLRSIMCAPLRKANHIFGVIYVDNQAKAGLFEDRDLQLLNAFAAQAAVAIDNARLYTQTDEHLAARVNELENLARITRELSKCKRLEKVAEVIQDWASAGSQADDTWVAMRVDTADSFLTRINAGEQGGQIPLHDPRVRGAVEAGTPNITLPQYNEPGRIVVPILADNQIAGVIGVESREPFDSGVVQYLTRLSNLAESAISRTRLENKVTAAAQEQADFISVVSHELRLPMTSIRGYTDLLRQGAMGEVNEQQQNFLDVIRKNVIRMNALVTGISDQSKIETGRIQLNPNVHAVGGLVDETIADQKDVLAEFEHTVELDIPASLPPVQVDADRFKQTLGQLIDNAAKYSNEGNEITIQAMKIDNRVKIGVKDSGYGIAPEDQPRIFEQFFRSEDQRVRDRHGWGVGLPVSKGLVALMGGEIGCVSELDKGSTFWFTVPVAVAE